MREIKFRGWDEIHKVMHYGFEFIRSGIEGNDWIIFKSDRQKLEKGEVFDNPYFAQQIKIMQFTGLKDKQGKEIYEGDIVKDAKEQVGKVFRQESTAQFAVNWLMEDGSYETDTCMEYGIVIGNIYQNPELLK